MASPRAAATALSRGTIAICGNPNCGKTTIFNHFTGLNQHVANYAGVTVERVSGQFMVGGDSRKFTLIDVPGAYSLAAYSPDEYIAAQALFGDIDGEQAPNAIIAVVDATNLNRGLYLVLQVLQIGRPVVVALNMIDLAERRGISIDAEKLSGLLGGIPVVPVVGSKGTGIEQLKQAAVTALQSTPQPNITRFDSTTEAWLARLSDQYGNTTSTRAHYLRVLFDVDGPAERKFVLANGESARLEVLCARQEIAGSAGSLTSAETSVLTAAAEELTVKAQRSGKPFRTPYSSRLDRFLLHPVLGPLVLVVLMMTVFQSIFSWAEPFMDLIDGAFGSLAALVESGMVDGPLRSLITDGIIGGVGSVLIFIPQIAILFLFLALLEDSGYMPRAAFLVDRIFRWCGLSGKSFIPMLSSFACAIPGIMATRTIEDRKLRLITMMVAPLMTCSARLPVYAIMIAAFIPHKIYLGLFNLQGLVLTALYLLGVAAAVIVSFVLNRTVFRTEQGTFMMELPSYKLPTARSVLIRVFNRVRSFVLRAGTVIMAITIVIWALSYFPRTPASDGAATAVEQSVEIGLPDVDENTAAGEHIRNSYFGRIGRTIGPAFEPLGWDWKITMAVLASFPAREVIIAVLGTIYNLGSDVDEESLSLVDKMRQAEWDYGAQIGRPVFNPGVALSIMVFFALCCQCGATLVTIRQEAGSWKYAIGVFAYMTTLAYLAALAVYQTYAWLVTT